MLSDTSFFNLFFHYSPLWGMQEGLSAVEQGQDYEILYQWQFEFLHVKSTPGFLADMKIRPVERSIPAFLWS